MPALQIGCSPSRRAFHCLDLARQPDCEQEMSIKNSQRRANRQDGIALLFTLVTLIILSALAASLILVTQTETWSFSNYQRMLQARYAAEAGAQNTLNWLLYSYTAPTSMTAYDLTKYPVQDIATHN